MNKEDFYTERKEAVNKRYSELRKEKKTRPEAMEIMEKEFSLSEYTLKQIMSNSKYNKPVRQKSETVPKAV